MEYEGKFVIENNCLLKCNDTKSACIIIPEGVTSIKNEIFDYYSDADVVILPKSIQKIEKDSFRVRKCLNHVICLSEDFDLLSSGSAFWGINTFYTMNQSAMEGTFDKGSPSGCYSRGEVIKINNGDFVIHNDTLIAYFGSDPSPKVPSNVTTIGSYAFAPSQNVREIVVPDTVTKLNPGAFSNLLHLERIVLNNNIKAIPTGCFSNCPVLSDVTLPSGIRTLEFQVFKGCLSLRDISSILKDVEVIGESAFYNCSSLKEVIFSDSIHTVNSRAFSHCSSLEHVSLGKVKTIKDLAFSDCTSLCVVDGSSCLYDIARNVFEGCLSLEAFKFHEGIFKISSSFFDKNAKIIKLSNNVTSVSAKGFQGFPNLEEIHLGSNLNDLGRMAFYGCEKLKTVYFESINVRLGEGVFYSTNYPLTIHYPGTAENWNHIISPRIEDRNCSVSSGQNGSAPGRYWDEYKIFPLGHKNEDNFICKVFCHGDGAELICKGNKESIYVCSHSPYDQLCQ